MAKLKRQVKSEGQKSGAKRAKSLVLMVEDQVAYAKVVSLKLRQEGYEVRVVDNKEDFFKVAKKYRPKLVLLDLILPREDGFEILSAIKKDKTLAGLKVVVFSALSQPEDVKRCYKLGAIDFFSKTDITLLELVKKIKRIIG